MLKKDTIEDRKTSLKPFTLYLDFLNSFDNKYNINYFDQLLKIFRGIHESRKGVLYFCIEELIF